MDGPHEPSSQSLNFINACQERENGAVHACGTERKLARLYKTDRFSQVKLAKMMCQQ